MEEKYAKAMNLFWVNKRAEALKLLLEIYDKDSDYKDTLLVIGKINYYDLKFPEAKKYFEKLYDKNPENLNALLWIIKSQFAAGIRDKSIFENLQTFMKRDPNNLEVLYISGRLLEEAGKTDLAIQSYNQILLQIPQIAFAHKQLAEIYKKANLSEKADFHSNQFQALTRKE
ncbi:tetratricopeptide repeat protein [Leptospira langatensis]|uniref:tetratricopeptide repeat protein n=1 Tax=Leptospira langatensis TaxID=2484983 RepID=UPI0014382985|nr:tetratricopeptide repeat protein [Leptospira langatensis]